MKWYQILLIVATVTQATLGILGIFLKGKTVKGTNSKKLYAKYGGDWKDNSCGGTWFSKPYKTYSFWWNMMSYCLGLLVLHLFIYLLAFYY